MANENFDKVYDVFREENLWDNIYVEFGEDEDGDHYCIFDGWDSVNKFTEQVKDILGLEYDEDGKLDVEDILDTNIVFSDEYSLCYDCQKVVRTSPTHYGWQPDFYVSPSDGIICEKCFDDNEGYQDEYIEEKINDPKSAINGLITEDQLETLGWEKWNSQSYENGWYTGQTDEPQEIYNELKSKFEEIVFFIDSVGQFDTHFSVWTRNAYEDVEEA